MFCYLISLCTRTTTNIRNTNRSVGASIPKECHSLPWTLYDSEGCLTFKGQCHDQRGSSQVSQWRSTIRSSTWLGSDRYQFYTSLVWLDSIRTSEVQILRSPKMGDRDSTCLVIPSGDGHKVTVISSLIDRHRGCSSMWPVNFSHHGDSLH